MSQIGNNIYPNTLFPDSIQTLPQFTDLTSEDESNYLSYLQAIIAGNLTNANYYLSLINPNSLQNLHSLKANGKNLLNMNQIIHMHNMI